jgi:hypothetical protein
MKTSANTKADGAHAAACEAVGIFMDADHLNKAIADLLASGFDRDALGLLASEHAVQQKLGNLYTRIKELQASPQAPETAFVKNESVEDTMHGLTGGLYFAGGTAAMGAVVASSAVLGGPLAVAITAAVAVGAVGALVGGIISKSEADQLREQVDEGRVLLFVRRLGDAGRARQAAEILSRHAAAPARLYEVPVKAGQDSGSS